MLTLQTKSYTDNLYNAANSGNYHYYLFINANYFSSVIADKENNQILKLSTYALPEADIFNLTYVELKVFTYILEEAEQKFKARSIVICNNTSVFVPDSLLNIVEVEKNYQINRLIEPNSQVLYCKMHFNHISSMFNVKNDLLKFIRFSIPMADVYHGGLLFAKAIEEQHFDNEQTKLHVNIHEHYFEIVNFNKGLKFYNTFNFDSETDIVYYILAVAEQLEIIGDVDVFLYGQSNLLESLNTLLKKYVKRVEFGIKPKKFLYPVAFNQFAEHNYFIEASALLCE